MLHQEIEISAFEKHLRKIDGLIKMTNEQRRPYIEMMESARKWLIQEMRLVDRVFDKLCTETSTSGKRSKRSRTWCFTCI